VHSTKLYLVKLNCN